MIILPYGENHLSCYAAFGEMRTLRRFRYSDPNVCKVGINQ